MLKDNQIQTRERVVFSIKNVWKIFVMEMFLFSLTLALGVATAFKFNSILASQGRKIPQISSFRFIFHFALATILIFLIIRFIKLRKQKGIIFKALFVFTVFFGGVMALSVWIPDITPLIVMGFLIIWWWKYPSVLIQDICMILGIIGVSSILGLSVSPEKTVFFLIIFSIYDFIAVYKTKHMVEMAKEMVKSKAILGLVIPPDIFSFHKHLKEIKTGGKFLILGGGDVVFPLLLCCSLIPFGLVKSLITAIFSLIGLLFSFYFFIIQKERKPTPALPPIAFFSIIGFLISKFF